MRWIAVALAGGLWASSGSVLAQAEPSGPTLSVTRIVASLQEGEPWGTVAGGLLCVTTGHLNWATGIGKLNVRGFENPAIAELKKEGFSVSGDPTDPFAEKSSADLTIGATITAIHGEFCVPGSYFNRTAVKGSASIDIDWQLYSTIERRTVWRAHAVGTAKTDVSKEGGFETVLFDALRDSLRKFTATDDFKKFAAEKPGSNERAAAAPGKSPIILAGSAAAPAMRMGDAVGSVVLILSGGGHGSGFLVSSDGYVMTAEHVVGADKYVKIRWSDGLEGVGEVIRTDKRRDVALIKTDPRGRQALGLSRLLPQPGDTVFAIGAPIDPKLQSTVTRGVASANRIMDGFSFIQSDVTVDPGNSGGPLLDEKGRVLGFTDLGLRTADAPTGLNFFVPIDDALRFLAVEPR